MEGFYEKVQDPKLNGAAFFAVCRGKVMIYVSSVDVTDVLYICALTGVD